MDCFVIGFLKMLFKDKAFVFVLYMYTYLKCYHLELLLMYHELYGSLNLVSILNFLTLFFQDMVLLISHLCQWFVISLIEFG